MGIEDIVDQIAEGLSEGFLKIHALPLYLCPEFRKDLLEKQTSLKQIASYAAEGITVAAYFLNSIQDKSWLLVPVTANVFSFYCKSLFTSSERIKQV